MITTKQALQHALAMWEVEQSPLLYRLAGFPWTVRYVDPTSAQAQGHWPQRSLKAALESYRECVTATALRIIGLSEKQAFQAARRGEGTPWNRIWAALAIHGDPRAITQPDPGGIH